MEWFQDFINFCSLYKNACISELLPFKAVLTLMFCVFVYYISDFRKRDTATLIEPWLVIALKCTYIFSVIAYFSCIWLASKFFISDIFTLTFTYMGTILVREAKKALGKHHAWAGCYRPLDKVIVRENVYEYIRHPMYIGIFFVSLGCVSFMLVHTHVIRLAFSLSIFLVLYLLFNISKKETSHIVSNLPHGNRYIQEVNAFWPVRQPITAWIEANTDDDKRLQILFNSQTLGTILTIATMILLANAKLLSLPSLGYITLIQIICITVVAMVNPRKIHPSFTNKNMIDIDAAIWIVYALDILTICCLIFKTGGLASSPFSAFLILLPTNGIILQQDNKKILCYFIGVFLMAFILGFPCERLILSDASTILLYNFSTVLVFSGTLVIACLGVYETSKRPINTG